MSAVNTGDDVTDSNRFEIRGGRSDVSDLAHVPKADKYTV